MTQFPSLIFALIDSDEPALILSTALGLFDLLLRIGDNLYNEFGGQNIVKERFRADDENVQRMIEIIESGGPSQKVAQNILRGHFGGEFIYEEM